MRPSPPHTGNTGRVRQTSGVVSQTSFARHFLLISFLQTCIWKCRTALALSKRRTLCVLSSINQGPSQTGHSIGSSCEHRLKLPSSGVRAAPRRAFMGQRLESLDGLRWLASFQVVLCHLRDWWDSLYWGSVWTQWLGGFSVLDRFFSPGHRSPLPTKRQVFLPLERLRAVLCRDDAGRCRLQSGSGAEPVGVHPEAIEAIGLGLGRPKNR